MFLSFSQFLFLSSFITTYLFVYYSFCNVLDTTYTLYASITPSRYQFHNISVYVAFILRIYCVEIEFEFEFHIYILYTCVHNSTLAIACVCVHFEYLMCSNGVSIVRNYFWTLEFFIQCDFVFAALILIPTKLFMCMVLSVSSLISSVLWSMCVNVNEWIVAIFAKYGDVFTSAFTHLRIFYRTMWVQYMRAIIWACLTMPMPMRVKNLCSRYLCIFDSKQKKMLYTFPQSAWIFETSHSIQMFRSSFSTFFPKKFVKYSCQFKKSKISIARIIDDVCVQFIIDDVCVQFAFNCATSFCLYFDEWFEIAKNWFSLILITNYQHSTSVYDLLLRINCWLYFFDRWRVFVCDHGETKLLWSLQKQRGRKCSQGRMVV